MSNKAILGIFKEARNIVVVQDMDTHEVEILGEFIDEGDEQEQLYIKQIYLSDGFKPDSTVITKPEVINNKNQKRNNTKYLRQ